MVGNRSVLSCFNLEIVVGFVLILAVGISHGYTDPSDGESRINVLYVYPVLCLSENSHGEGGRCRKLVVLLC